MQETDSGKKWHVKSKCLFINTLCNGLHVIIYAFQKNGEGRFFVRMFTQEAIGFTPCIHFNVRTSWYRSSVFCFTGWGPSGPRRPADTPCCPMCCWHGSRKAETSGADS